MEMTSNVCLFSCFAFYLIWSSETLFCFFVSTGNQKQCGLPGVDPVLPGHVLFLPPLSGLVRQLTQLGSNGRHRRGICLVLAHVGDLIRKRWQHWDWMYGWPCRAWFTKKRSLLQIVQEEVVGRSSLVLTICFFVEMHLYEGRLCVCSTVSTLSVWMMEQSAFCPPLNTVIICSNCSCLSKKKLLISDWQYTYSVVPKYTVLIDYNHLFFQLYICPCIWFCWQCICCFAF